MQPRRSQTTALCLVVATLLVALTSAPAMAYVGPGAGLSAIGSLVALFAAVGLAVVGFVWYPVKRLRQRRKQAENKPTA